MDFLWQCQKIKRDGVSRGLWAGGGVCKTFLPNLNENLVNFHLAGDFPLKNWDKCYVGAFKGALITSAISGPFFKAQLSGQRYTMTRKLWLEIFTYCKNAANPPEIFLCANFFYIVTFLFERDVRTGVCLAKSSWCTSLDKSTLSLGILEVSTNSFSTSTNSFSTSTN